MRRDSAFPALTLDRSSERPIYRQLYEQLTAAIRAGELRHRLPSSRDLSRRLNVSRNTVIAAYELLIEDDLVMGKIGAGMRIRYAPPLTGLKSISLSKILRVAHYPQRTISLTDPDGNAVYLNF